MKVSKQHQHSCGTLEGCIKISVAWSKSYKSLSTLLTITPCYTRYMLTSKTSDAP